MAEKFWFGKNKPLTSDKLPSKPEEAINSEGVNLRGSSSTGNNNQQSDTQEISGGPAPGPDPFVNLRNKYGGGSPKTEQPQTSEISEQPNNQQSNTENSDEGNI